MTRGEADAFSALTVSFALVSYHSWNSKEF